MNGVKQVLASGLALLQFISGACASNFLTSQPSQVNGSVIACAGEEISLTCSHDNTISATTVWIISSPVNCSTEITHNPPTQVAPPCEPFSFQDITLAKEGVVQLNSSAVATASSEISGSIIECIKGFVQFPSVGNISLCIIDELPAPVNLRCMEVSQGLLVSWDVVTDGCAISSIVYDITVIGEANGNASMNNVKDAHIEIPDSLLEPNQTYTIYVRAKLVQGTCETREAAIVCGDSFPATSPVATDDEGMTTTSPETQNGSSVSAAVVAVPIVLILALMAAIVIVILIIFGYMYYRRHGKLPCNLTLLSVRMFKDKDSSHPHELTHTQGPDGDWYTDINKAPGKSKDHEAQQDRTKYNEYSDESKDPDVKTNITPKEDDKPPPKPKRISKAESEANETKDKEKAFRPPPSKPGYEDLDNL